MSEVASAPPLGRNAGGNILLADKRPDTAFIKRQKLAACQNNVPPVHGRTNPALHVRTRLSNHQRNLSLDFRSAPDMDFPVIFAYIFMLPVTGFNLSGLCLLETGRINCLMDMLVGHKS
jgi:hypothetical protein